jgi:hypothetical protein
VTLHEIKTAVRAGKTVCWSNPDYVVTVDKIGQWLVTFAPTGFCWGLTHTDGKTMNGKEQDFFIKEAP